jgi:hypothetical protein
MKKILFLIITIFLLTSCGGSELKDPNLLYGQKCILRNKWISGRHSDHYFLISLLEDSTMIREFYVRKEKFWIRNIGDTLTFDYIRKDAFFKSNGNYEILLREGN